MKTEFGENVPNPKFWEAVTHGTQTDLKDRLADAAECGTTADDHTTAEYYRREMMMIEAIGRFRFPDTW